MSNTVDNYQDTLDSRDIEERIAELESIRDNAEDATEFPMLDEDREELKTLLALREEAEGYAPDWKYGTTLIRDSYFTEYARDLASEIGSVDFAAMAWPLGCIDWERAARELQHDYTSVEFGDVTYWVR